MPTATAPKKLSAAQARQLADADAKVAKLAAQLKKAETKRNEVRDRLRDRIVPNEEMLVGGYLVKVATYTTRAFKIAQYLDAGKPLTVAMRRFYSETPRESWTVKRTDG